MPKRKRTPREEIERAFHVSFMLPDQATKLLDRNDAVVRNEALTEAAAIVRATPIPAEAGPDWHWYDFARNRAAERLLAARTSQEATP